MAPRIDEPVQLGQFATTSKQGQGVLLVSRDVPGDDTITVAVDVVGVRSVPVSPARKQGDGLKTFGEGFKFASRAVTVIHSDQVQRTYAAAARYKDSGKTDAGKVLSVWSRPVESSSDAPAYAKLKLGTRISGVHTAPGSDQVVVVHGDASVSLVSAGLEVVPTRSAPRSLESVLESWVFPCETCGFASALVGGSVVLVFGRVDGSAWLFGFIVKDGEIEVVGEVELGDVDALNIAGASCSEDGFLSILQSTGLCTTFTLSLSNALAATPLPAPLQFQGLSTQADSSLAIHALTGSILILAGVTTASPAKLALLMWDTQYSTLLAERLVPLPTTSDSAPTLSLSGSTSNHLTITFSSYIFGVSIAAPSTSSIASALGPAHPSSTHWLSPARIKDNTHSALIDRIRLDVQARRAPQADAAFFRWVEATAEAEAQGTLASATKAAAKIPFPSAFAAALVEAAFPAAVEDAAGKEKEGKREEGPDFASGVVSTLIWRGAARQGMVRRPGGLYGELRRRRDWPIMLSALQHVSDIPEDEIVATIRDLLIPANDSSNPLTNAPTLQNGLVHLLAYPTSPAPLRLALRAHLQDAEDIERVLKVIDAWLKRGLQFDVWELDGLQSVPGKPGKGKNVGVSASSGRKKVKGAGTIPALEHILTFTQALLDTHFLTLLQHRPAHPLLRSVSASLSPLPAHNDALQTLAAPLAPFVAEDALERKTGSATARPGNGGWVAKEEQKKQRRAHFAAEAIAIGEYRFEELIL
ncbi:hypothetical protein FS749_010605 [Ceratobasidium sp. UAMH 11750]|nr:hypothetical protein FS749_010605 [Ceratobasidium sp. UAMH 11750]